MLIKVDCREKEIYTKITNVVSTTDKIGGGSKKLNTTATKTKSAPRFHIMDLGDGMTIQVPIPASMEKGSKGSRGNGGGNGHGRGEKSLEHEELNQEKDEETDKITDNVGGGDSRHKIISARMPIGDMSIEWENENNHGDSTDATGATAPAEAGVYVLFERKTLYDLAASIKDGRYKEQSFRLENTILHNHDIVYIVEGDLSKYDERRGGISKTAIQSAMVSLLYYKGFSVYRTMNTDETAAFIVNFADKIQSNSSSSKNETEMERSGGLGYYRRRMASVSSPAPGKILGESDDGYSEVAVKKEKRDFITPKNIGEIMLSNIPGVSPKIAAAIMKKYNNSMFEFLHDLKRKNDIFEESISNTNKIPPPSKILAECFADIEIYGNKDGKGIEGNMDDVDLGGDETAKESSSSSSRDKHQIRKIGKATIDKIYKYLC
jgi:ERCC4-type nuclease